MRTNPYLNRMPVREPSRFFGRKREVRRILDGLGADPPQSFSVVGDRRIGKSSLLHQVRHPDAIAAHLGPDAGASFRVRYHDFQAGVPADEAGFVAFLCAEVAAATGAARPEQAGRERLVEMLREAEAGSLRLVFLWDEFEVVTRHRAIGPDLYALLRSLLQNHRLGLVVASGRDLRSVCHSTRVADSPFFNVFQTVRLRTFSRDESLALVRDPSVAAGLPLERHAGLAIDRLAGTFPFFLQIACAAIFEHMDEEGVDEPDAAAVEARFLEEAEPHFRYFWEERLSAEERAVVVEAARGRVTGGAGRRLAERLEKDGYLLRLGDGFAPFSRCFAGFVLEAAEDDGGAPETGAANAMELGETRAERSAGPGAPAEGRSATPGGRRASTPGPIGPASVLLGKYEIVSAIGEGGMGKVFLAKHLHLGRQVAVKVLGPHVACLPDMVTRFRREAMAASAIGHPNVVQVHDFDWHEDGRPFIVMEYLEGEDLATRIYGRGGRERRPLAPGEAVAVVRAACDALGEAHDRGILHRDIKPSNIFLACGPGTPPPGPLAYAVKILDFGISKIVAGGSQVLTRASNVLGTPCYMAPEQITDPSATGPAADQYALGVVLYEALTATVPFEAGPALSRPFLPAPPPPPPPPSARRPGLAAALDSAALRAMEFRPQDRFDCVRAFAAALLVAQAGGS